MIKAVCGTFFAFLVANANPASAGGVRAPPLPKIFDAVKGCWRGDGNVLGKPVVLALRTEPILLNSLFAIDADSHATAHASDQYQAHLLFGGNGHSRNALWGFWSDSFGADFTAQGDGAASADGFDLSYHYPGTAYINRWRVQGDRLNWFIVSKAQDAKEKPFATYELKRVRCSGGTVVP